MNRQLPPLNALKAFEAAARHLSFTEAAEELHVTQGAISRQIKTLEEHFQNPLFERHHRRLTLTDDGKKLLPVLNEIFDRIQAISDEIRGGSEDLTIKVLPSFAIRWLIPRLPKFQKLFPEINVRLTTAWHTVAFDKEHFDAGIVHSMKMRQRNQLHKTIITPEWMTPACSPKLLNGKIRTGDVNSLKNLTLLHCGGESYEWIQWCKEAHTSEVDPKSGQVFDLMDTALRAAASGFGIALADLMMISDELETGHLVTPFPDIASLVGVYYLVCPHSKANKPALKHFRKWLTDECRAIIDNSPDLQRLEARDADLLHRYIA
ncbi:transcriptional regulator GcvA [Kiloniella laminariae]|uniref:Transcriptional regulator GcvA n=1 Tax=Kiloniella laminariae TaxID=454162 RepID=A0ABT4LDY9_9PROT|nr:transcriptional regulator GcvA [Kiloniella laminariae]MCZ4279306.1 transcriptional regulator GcvA [Kiloniella laminariae]